MIYIDIQATGENIKEFLEQNHITPKDVAKECGFTTCNTVYKWFRGESLPSIDSLVIVADMIGVPVDNLLVVVKSDEK